MNDLDILQQINKIGQLLLKHGAEIYRVEESLKRMCEGFGFTDIEVFAIPTYFTLSIFKTFSKQSYTFGSSL